MVSDAPAIEPATEESPEFESSRILLISGGHFVHGFYCAIATVIDR